jgi:hypothetical protein
MHDILPYTRKMKTIPTWFSETIRGKLVHRTKLRAELLPLLGVAEGVNHPVTHAAQK